MILSEKVDAFLEKLESLRKMHWVEDRDSWFSCPKSGHCCNSAAGEECNCGADDDNEILDELLAEVRAASEEIGVMTDGIPCLVVEFARPIEKAALNAWIHNAMGFSHVRAITPVDEELASYIIKANSGKLNNSSQTKALIEKYRPKEQ